MAGKAVFARNYGVHLEGAAALPAEQLATFRSQTRWVSAAKAVAEEGSIPIYFASGDGSEVRYQADLVAVRIDPEPGDELLQHSVASTEGEELWDNKVRTLYAIKGCRPVEPPFPMTRLIKVSDGLPIDPNFRRSYVNVFEVEKDTGTDVG